MHVVMERVLVLHVQHHVEYENIVVNEKQAVHHVDHSE